MDWREKALEVAKKLGLPKHEMEIFEYLLGDISTLKEAVREKDAMKLMMAASSLSFHKGELFQRGVLVGGDPEMVLNLIRPSVHFWDLVSERVETIQLSVTPSIVEMPPLKFEEKSSTAKGGEEERAKDILRRAGYRV